MGSVDKGMALPLRRGRGGRMTVKRNCEAVIRLFRGEDLETVSRDLGVTAAKLTRGVFGRGRDGPQSQACG